MARRDALLLGLCATALLPGAAPAQTAAAVAVGATTSEPGPGVEFPRRQPGLWEVRSAGAQSAGVPLVRFCVGEATDTAAQHLDRVPGVRGSCSLGAFRRDGSAWVAESVCRDNRSTASSRALASGDFVSAYRIDTVVRYDPPLGGVRAEDRDSVSARRLGDCAAGQRPGDMIIPGMGTLNMTDGHFRPEPAARPARPPGAATARP
jgi:hypothetical protein